MSLLGTLTNNRLQLIHVGWGASTTSHAIWTRQTPQPGEVPTAHETMSDLGDRSLSRQSAVPIGGDSMIIELVAKRPTSSISPLLNVPGVIANGTHHNAVVPPAFFRCACLSSEWSAPGSKIVVATADAPITSTPGDAVDRAVAQYLYETLGENGMREIRNRFAMVRKLPFSSTIKLTLALYRMKRDQTTADIDSAERSNAALAAYSPSSDTKRSLDPPPSLQWPGLVVCKGAVEHVLARCTSRSDGRLYDRSPDTGAPRVRLAPTGCDGQKGSAHACIRTAVAVGTAK